MPLDGTPMRWGRGDKLAADKLNDTPDLLEKLQRRVEQLERTLQKSTNTPPLTWRVKVTKENVATNPIVQIVTVFDQGGAALSSGIPVVSLCRMQKDDEFYVVRPANGIIGAPTYKPANASESERQTILFRDLRLAGTYYVGLEASGGTAGANPANRTYDLSLAGYGATISTSAQAPYYRAQVAFLIDATQGLAYIDSNGNATLLMAFEGFAPAFCGDTGGG